LKTPRGKPRGIFTVRNTTHFMYGRLPRRKQRGMRSLKRFKDLICFFFIPKRIDGDLPWLTGDELAIDFEGHRRRVVQVFESAKDGVEIWQHPADVLIQMRDTVQRLESRVTFWPEDFFGIGFE
jgi:hypothetical protein